ncbi:KIF17 protein, partial [Pitta sordida]|nr:KIF17 protein [Pitta sordida]
VTEAYNGTISAYSQTGSRKSFTVQGVVDPSHGKGSFPGRLNILESFQNTENTKFSSCLEIYSQDTRDLLGADTRQKLE